MIQYHRVFRRKKFRLRLPSRTLALGERTLVMGVLNVTPDSFSDGGLYFDSHAAIERGFAIARAGAALMVARFPVGKWARSSGRREGVRRYAGAAVAGRSATVRS